MGWDVQLDTDMRALAARVLDAERPLVDSLHKRLGAVADRAVRLAPVKTGQFKRSIARALTLSPIGEVVGSIVATVPYAWYINRGFTVKKLIFEPAERAAEQALQDTADQWGER